MYDSTERFSNWQTGGACVASKTEVKVEEIVEAPATESFAAKCAAKRAAYTNEEYYNTTILPLISDVSNSISVEFNLFAQDCLACESPSDKELLEWGAAFTELDWQYIWTFAIKPEWWDSEEDLLYKMEELYCDLTAHTNPNFEKGMYEYWTIRNYNRVYSA